MGLLDVPKEGFWSLGREAGKDSWKGVSPNLSAGICLSAQSRILDVTYCHSLCQFLILVSGQKQLWPDQSHWKIRLCVQKN